MASKDSLEVRNLASVGTVVVSRDDTPVAIRLRTTAAAGAVTSVIVTAATNIVMITAGGGTDTYAFATYTTIGALADAINSDGIFEAVVLDALRSDLTASSTLLGQTITSGTDANGVVVWDVNPDTSVLKAMTTTLSLHRNFDFPQRGHVVKLQEIVYNVDVNGASANAVRIYQRIKGVEVQLNGIASVDATKTTINWASGVGFITGADNADLIVRVQDATSLTDATANFVQVTGLLV